MPSPRTTRQDIHEILCKTLKVNEIFFSLQGETRFIGLPTIFIRLTGCPLRCNYCDTDYAFHDGEKITIENILQNISNYRSRYVTVTGGEPLAQKHCHDLLTLLCDEGFEVSLETSGAICVEHVDERVYKILDIKTPASGESDKNNFNNLQYIKESDQIKFVIVDKFDYQWSRDIIKEHQLNERCEILFSPAYETLDPEKLAGWILQDQLPVRMQIQLQTYIWGDVPGR